MFDLVQPTQKFIADEEGATVVEYGILLALVIAGCIAILITFGGQISGWFRSFNGELSNAGVK